MQSACSLFILPIHAFLMKVKGLWISVILKCQVTCGGILKRYRNAFLLCLYSLCVLVVTRDC